MSDGPTTVQTKRIGGCILVKAPVGPHEVFFWVLADGRKAEAPRDFDAIGMHVWYTASCVAPTVPMTEEELAEASAALGG
jgi:hypothetical protein